MSVVIGHASINENGTVNYGALGDNNTKEICFRDFYWHNKGWVCLRAKSSEVSDKIAHAMEMIVKNDCFGYGQNRRNTGITQSQVHNYNPSKVTVMCELDCSSAVRLCCLFAGIKVNNFTTANQKSKLLSTGYFKEVQFTDEEELQRGDILVTATKGHTVVVITNGNLTGKPSIEIPSVVIENKKATKPASHRDSDLSGTYRTTVDLHMRNGAGIEYESMVVIPKGTRVKNYGYYSLSDSKIIWLYIKVVVNNITYTGFSSSKYLEKI